MLYCVMLFISELLLLTITAIVAYFEIIRIKAFNIRISDGKKMFGE